MLISTKELRIYLKNVGRKLTSNSMSQEDYKQFILESILKDVCEWEAHQLKEMGEPPCGLGVDREMALVVYCGRKLYDFVEKFSVDTEEDVNVLTIGKIYMEVKKALKEGKFKRV